jgi:hypothetical protein
MAVPVLHLNMLAKLQVEDRNEAQVQKQLKGQREIERFNVYIRVFPFLRLAVVYANLDQLAHLQLSFTTVRIDPDYLHSHSVRAQLRTYHLHV